MSTHFRFGGRVPRTGLPGHGAGSMSAGHSFLLLLVFGWTVGSQCESDIPALHDKLSLQRNISKRELTCEKGKYPQGNICCKMCAPGSFKDQDCTGDRETHCTPCTEESFMDHLNYETKCRRCQPCDTTFGFEIAENCTITQNTKCRCAQHFFCDSSAPCKHCEPCDKCENGTIEKECTPTTNTICKSKGNFWWIYLVGVGIPVAILSSSIAVYCYKKKRQNFDLNEQKLDLVVHRPYAPAEKEPLMYLDVDLSTHISAIVEDMTLQQVKAFMRKNKIAEPVIEQALQDHLNDSTEQKIKLFHIWYQEHGMKGAFGNLISTLRELKMRAIADKIEEKLKVVPSSTQDNGQ